VPKALIIAIDGPAAAGKSSVAIGLARRLGYKYLDTGALYRAMAWKMIVNMVDIEVEADVATQCQSLEVSLSLKEGLTEVWVDGLNATPQLRRPEVSQAASRISTYAVVREKLLSIQRAMAEAGGVVAEGRDVGTVVFPKADLKFYLDAQIETRGKRRHLDLVKAGEKTDPIATTQAIAERDRRDRQRTYAPLKRASDAILIDSTFLSEKEVVDRMVHEAMAAGAVP